MFVGLPKRHEDLVLETDWAEKIRSSTNNIWGNAKFKTFEELENMWWGNKIWIYAYEIGKMKFFLLQLL